MAANLPVEGEDGPFLGQDLSEVPTCAATGTVAAARLVLHHSGAGEAGADDVVVVHGEGMAVGLVDAEAIDGVGDDVPLLDVLRPVPSTVRPSVTVASVAEGGGGQRLVTTSDGRLLGRALVGSGAHEGHDHEGHDHEGHDHGAPELDGERYEAELTAVLLAMKERFAGRDPSAEEVHAFLRERLVAEGRTPEEADRFLQEMEASEGG